MIETRVSQLTVPLNNSFPIGNSKPSLVLYQITILRPLPTVRKGCRMQPKVYESKHRREGRGHIEYGPDSNKIVTDIMYQLVFGYIPDYLPIRRLYEALYLYKCLLRWRCRCTRKMQIAQILHATSPTSIIRRNQEQCLRQLVEPFLFSFYSLRLKHHNRGYGSRLAALEMTIPRVHHGTKTRQHAYVHEESLPPVYPRRCRMITEGHGTKTQGRQVTPRR